MKKKYLSALLFGAIIAASSVTFTSCKDYDDEINGLQEQVDAIKASISDLETKIKAGNWVTSVNDVEGGFEITFNDGKKYTIVNGEEGTAGKNGTEWTIDKDGYWCKDGVRTEYKAIGEKGDKGDQGDQGDKGDAGVSGKSPYINSETQTWWCYDDDKKEWYDTEILVTNNSIYITQIPGRPAYELNVWNKDTEEFAKLLLPSSSSISDLKLMNIEGTQIQEGVAELTYYYGQAPADIEFNGKKYAKDETLYSHKTRPAVYAQINPSDVDFTDTKNGYSFELVNSKGESEYTIKTIEKYMTEGALSRAEATWNKGVYKLIIKEEINNTMDAYALSTTDAYGHNIISAYDLKINSEKVNSQFLVNAVEALSIGENHDLYAVALSSTKNTSRFSYNTLDDVVAYNFELAPNTEGVSISEVDGKEFINSVKPQTVDVYVNYLTLQGTKERVKLTINFHKIVNFDAIDVDLSYDLGRRPVDILKYLDVDAQVKEIINENSIPVKGSTSAYDIYIENTDLIYNPATLDRTGIDGKLVKMKLDDPTNGVEAGKFYFLAEISTELIDDVTYPISFELKTNFATYALCKLDINVTRNDNLFAYYKKSLWFEEGSWNAKAYGTPVSNGIRYDMFELFAENIGGQPFEIATSEKMKFKFSDADNVNPWFTPIDNDHDLLIARNQMYKQHNLTVSYYPWNNENLTPISQEFTLEFKSPYYEADQENVKDVTLKSLTDKHEFKKENFKWIDPRSKEVFDWTNSTEVVSMNLKLTKELSLYVELDNIDIKNRNANLKFKEGVTMPVSTVTGKMTLTVMDAWGVQSTQDVNIILEP